MIRAALRFLMMQWPSPKQSDLFLTTRSVTQLNAAKGTEGKVALFHKNYSVPKTKKLLLVK
jgi:hypothetical protein